MTWGDAPELVATIRSIMLDSREAFVHYTMPLGLHHLIGGDHYAPMPENTDPRRADWSATYYHRADASGIGYDRTRRGSGAVDQYRSPLRELVERSRDHARRAAPVVPPPALGLPHEVGTHAVGRAGRSLRPRRRRSARDSKRAGRRCAARWTRSGTRRCSPSCAGRRTMPPRGATSASATSRPPRAQAALGSSPCHCLTEASRHVR